MGKNVSHAAYSIQFIRGRLFRMELHAKQSLGVSYYSLVYYWDGKTWSSYNSLELQRNADPVTRNMTADDLIGPGVALTYGLFPDTSLLLGVKDAGFYDFNNANTTSGWFHGRRVYRLTLTRVNPDGTFDSTHGFWIDPKRYVILKDRYHDALRLQDHIDTTSRQTTHSPEMNTLAPDAVIEFRPPTSRLNQE